MGRLFFILCALLCVSCVGQKEEILESDLQLVADKVLLSVDNEESATFSVLLNGEDVTGESTIFNITDGTMEELREPVFTPQEGCKGGDYFALGKIACCLRLSAQKAAFNKLF